VRPEDVAVNKAEWLACDDPLPMLECIKSKAGERKLRLFACACLRQARVPARLRPDDRLRAVVEAVESAADGAGALPSGSLLASPDALFAARWAANHALSQDPHAASAPFAPFAALLRDVFGNPLPLALADVHRTPDVVSLARAAYDERILPRGDLDSHRLAVLADALEEVGAPGELVAHLRKRGPHVRGCHVVDLCLGLG